MRIALFTGAALCSLVAAGTAAAQQATSTIQPTAPPPVASNGQPSAVQEVVVTALKRTVSLQQVAATVAVVPGATLTKQNVTSALGLQSVVPGLELQTAPGVRPVALIHGLGSDPTVGSFDQSVSLFVDGVYAGHGEAYATPLFDVNDVEVVKGTQSALLGKNTSIGAVALTTNKPDFSFGYDLSYSHEFYLNQNVVDGEINVPLSDTFAIRIAAQHNQGDGWIHDSLTGRNDPSNNNNAGRITLRWAPIDHLNWTLSYQQAHLDRQGPIFFAAEDKFGVLKGIAAALGFPNFSVGPWDQTQQLTPDFGVSTEKRLTSTVTYDWHGYSFTSLTGYYLESKTGDVNGDALPISPFTGPETQADNQISQELRVSSPQIGRFSYVFGGLYLHDTWSHDEETALTAPLPLTGTASNVYTQHVDSGSVFGQGNFDITEKLRVTAGLRETEESKTGDFARFIPVPGLVTLIFPPIAPTSLSRQEDDLDGSVGLQYKVDREKMLYVSYSKGTKSGGYQDDPTTLADAPYKAEVARTIEVGAKWGFGNVGHINLAVFNTDVSNFQLGTFNGEAFVVNNIDANSKGVDLDVVWQPLPGLSAGLNGTYADTTNTHPVPATLACTEASSCFGSTMPYAPRWTGAALLDYSHSLGPDYNLTAEASVDFRSKMALVIQTTTFIRPATIAPQLVPPSDPYAKFNLRIAINNPRTGIEFAIVARNLNNARTATYGYQAPLGLPGALVLSTDQPRTIALQISVKR